MKKLTFIDLFCGCGGFSLGMQSFLDWFEFPIARTHQFRVIGNAVPPLVSEAVGSPLLN